MMALLRRRKRRGLMRQLQNSAGDKRGMLALRIIRIEHPCPGKTSHQAECKGPESTKKLMLNQESRSIDLNTDPEWRVKKGGMKR